MKYKHGLERLCQSNSHWIYLFENYLDNNWDFFLTFAISITQSLWIGSRIRSRVKIIHYIQSSYLSSALLRSKENDIRVPFGERYWRVFRFKALTFVSIFLSWQTKKVFLKYMWHVSNQNITPQVRLKMNVKKLSRFQFYFSGVLEAFSMLKPWKKNFASLDFGDNSIYPISNPDGQDQEV